MSRSTPTLRAILVGIYLFSVPAFAYSESLGLLAIPQITGAALVAYAILDILGSLRLTIPGEIRLYGFMGLWAAGTYILGTITSEWNALGSLIKVVVATLACAQLIKDDADFLVALKIFVFSILLVYFQNMSDLRYLRAAGQIKEVDRFAGTLANANTAAIYALTVIWACLFIFLNSKTAVLRWILFLVPVGISLSIIYYSGSKKGLIGTGLLILFLVRLLYFRHRSSLYGRTAVILFSVLLIILAGYFIYTSPFFFRIKELYYGESGSDVNRLNLIKEAIGIWLTNWKTFFMGVGNGNYHFFSQLSTYSHSTPFELLACNGIIGLSLFAGFLWLLFRRFIILLRRTENLELRRSFFSILIFLVLFVFFSLAAVMHDSRELLPILGCLAAYGHYHFLLLPEPRGKGTILFDRE